MVWSMSFDHAHEGRVAPVVGVEGFDHLLQPRVLPQNELLQKSLPFSVMMRSLLNMLASSSFTRSVNDTSVMVAVVGILVYFE